MKSCYYSSNPLDATSRRGAASSLKLSNFADSLIDWHVVFQAFATTLGLAKQGGSIVLTTTCTKDCSQFQVGLRIRLALKFCLYRWTSYLNGCNYFTTGMFCRLGGLYIALLLSVGISIFFFHSFFQGKS
ncbi:uncharacterized protein LOC126621758 [Malus sylvestris]|uniref:uncharacterized protein LOC126621758 n=1 Tax=Malus sylvestris TaxID=3752 RepID=UPI0021AD07B1|nr:uncharacterized protein LOC126621758 [Malus sylvestris]